LRIARRDDLAPPDLRPLVDTVLKRLNEAEGPSDTAFRGRGGGEEGGEKRTRRVGCRVGRGVVRIVCRWKSRGTEVGTAPVEDGVLFERVGESRKTASKVELPLLVSEVMTAAGSFVSVAGVAGRHGGVTLRRRKSEKGEKEAVHPRPDSSPQHRTPAELVESQFFSLHFFPSVPSLSAFKEGENTLLPSTFPTRADEAFPAVVLVLHPSCSSQTPTPQAS
jgi:hypothetical protein